ncbi:MAG: NERD domain-containing protein [Sulfuritalea sp.]|jgi:hypothetical protein|nr:NERD domain-containing protein [Sulfuritalea sp.]
MLIKSADDKKKRLRLLQELAKSDRLDERQKDWLRDEYRRLAPGTSGERDAAHYLDMSFSGGMNHAVLHDLRLEADGQIAQIDHLVVDRLLNFFLLETKTYNGSLHVNEHGEFMVEYAGERRYGIESPLEQSRRHETVLKKVLERLKITGRAGTTPTFVHIVMVHPKGIIHRPAANKFDTSMIIKADQFATWHSKHVDKMDAAAVLAGALNLRGRDTVKDWGEMLKAEHRPTNPLELPDFIKPNGRVPTTLLTPRAAVAEPQAAHAMTSKPGAPSTRSSSSPGKHHAAPVCATCGNPLTPKAHKFCQDKAAWFGGKLYCYDHQAAAKRA